MPAKPVPAVSVCVPTYNGAKYLAQCLESVLVQTYEDWELVVLDDCSTDATLEIAAAYAMRDSRIRVESNAQNIGLVANWNRCVQIAGGTWIKFVFQDDFISEQCLGKMLDAARPDASIIACRRDFLFADDTLEAQKRFYLDIPTLDTLFGSVPLIDRHQICEAAIDLLGVNFIGEPAAVLFRRDLFKRFGAFNTGLIMICDTEYWIRVASNTGLNYVPEQLATFRVHGESTSFNNFASRSYRMTLDGVLLLYEYCYGAAYSKLREAALGRLEAFDLNGLLIRKAKGARWLAIDSAGRRNDGVPLQEWKQFGRAHPEIVDLLSKEDVKERGMLRRVGNVLNLARRMISR